MTVKRISNAAFEVLLSGDTRQSASCVIKFYSNRCHFCHELKKDYLEISKEFDEVHFFAFNTDDYPFLDKLINIQGVPTIAYIRTGRQPYVSILSEPADSHGLTWYHKQDIIDFIKKEIK